MVAELSINQLHSAPEATATVKAPAENLPVVVCGTVTLAMLEPSSRK